MSELTTYGDISEETGVYLNKPFLDRALPVMYTAQFAQTLHMPKNASQRLKARRYNPLSAEPKKLVEGVTPRADNVSTTDVYFNLEQFGNVLRLTDVVADTHEDPVLQQYTELLGEQAGEMMERIRIAKLLAGTNVYYANGESRSEVNTTVNKAMDDPHSPFVDGSRWYVADGSTLYDVTGLRKTPLVTGLSAGLRLAWCKLADAIYWSNGVQKGRIGGGAAKRWGGFAFSSDVRENAEYLEPPAGTVLAAFGGRIWIGVDDEILYTVPGFPHHIRRGSCRLPRQSSAVRMIAPVDDGFYISTEDRITFVSGWDVAQMTQTVVSHEPVIPRMFLPVLASDVVPRLNPVRGVLWATARGLELGISQGNILKLTANEVAINVTASGGAMLRLPRRVVALYHA